MFVASVVAFSVEQADKNLTKTTFRFNSLDQTTAQKKPLQNWALMMNLGSKKKKKISLTFKA